MLVQRNGIVSLESFSNFLQKQNKSLNLFHSHSPSPSLSLPLSLSLYLVLIFYTDFLRFILASFTTDLELLNRTHIDQILIFILTLRPESLTTPPLTYLARCHSLAAEEKQRSSVKVSSLFTIFKYEPFDFSECIRSSVPFVSERSKASRIVDIYAAIICFLLWTHYSVPGQLSILCQVIFFFIEAFSLVISLRFGYVLIES